MPLIDRSDLQYDYTWSAYPGNNPRSGSTSKSSMFRRNEGSDVLAIINEYAKEKDIKTKEEALKIERLIREKLAEDNMTREEVRIWLENKV